MVQMCMLHLQVTPTVWQISYDMQGSWHRRDRKQKHLQKIKKLWILLLLTWKRPPSTRVIWMTAQPHLNK
jgi:hypothetical protein